MAAAAPLLPIVYRVTGVIGKHNSSDYHLTFIVKKQEAMYMYAYFPMYSYPDFYLYNISFKDRMFNEKDMEIKNEIDSSIKTKGKISVRLCNWSDLGSNYNMKLL